VGARRCPAPPGDHRSTFGSSPIDCVETRRWLRSARWTQRRSSAGIGSSWSILPVSRRARRPARRARELALAAAAVVLDVDEDARPLAHLRDSMRLTRCWSAERRSPLRPMSAPRASFSSPSPDHVEPARLAGLGPRRGLSNPRWPMSARGSPCPGQAPRATPPPHRARRARMASDPARRLRPAPPRDGAELAPPRGRSALGRRHPGAVRGRRGGGAGPPTRGAVLARRGPSVRGAGRRGVRGPRSRSAGPLVFAAGAAVVAAGAGRRVVAAARAGSGGPRRPRASARRPRARCGGGHDPGRLGAHAEDAAAARASGSRSRDRPVRRRTPPRRLRRASSTDLPVNSWYSLMSASSPSSALRPRSRGRTVVFGVDEDRSSVRRPGWRSLACIGSARRRHLDREAWACDLGEPGVQPRQRERPAPADDQVLLDDREDGPDDPVDEQAGGQEAAVQDRDERQEQAIWRCIRTVRVRFFGSGAGSIIRDWTSWRKADRRARMLIPKPASGSRRGPAGLTGCPPSSGNVSMHGFVTGPGLGVSTRSAQSGSVTWTPNTSASPLGRGWSGPG
jgi:hypothetical protein